MAERKLDLIIGAKDATGSVFDAVEHRLKHLSGQTGKRGALGEISEVLLGGGAVLGLSLAGEAVNKLTEGLVKFDEGLSDASKSAGELADSFLRSLPILGSIYSAGRNIRDLITGEAADVARITENAKTVQETFEAQEEAASRVKKAIEGIDTTISNLRRKAESAGLHGEALQLFGINASEEDTKREIDKAVDTATDELRTKLVTQRRKLQDELSKIGPVTPAGSDLNSGLRGFLRAAFPLAGVFSGKDTGAIEQRAQLLRTQIERINRQLSQEQSKLTDKGQQADTAAIDAATAERISVLRGALGKFLALGAEQAQKVREGFNKFISERADIAEQLRKSALESRLSLLDQESEAGNKAAAVEAARLRIAEDFLAKRRELLRIVESETASAQQKADAERQISELGDAEARAKALAGRQAATDPRFAPLQDERFTTGIGSALRQGAAGVRDPQVDETKKNTAETQKNTQALNKTSAAIEAWSRNYTGGGPPELQ